jgi:two-component system, chemotaxis family, sensor kinase CheA
MPVRDESLAELFEQYKDEVRENIETVDTELVAIEQDPANSEIIFSIFRRLHTIKGSSKMFNVDNIGHIAHKLEDLMHMIDQDNSILKKQPKIIELLFQGNDIFRDIIARLEGDIGYVHLTQEHAAFIEQINRQIDKISRKEDLMVGLVRALLEELDVILPGLEDLETRSLRQAMQDLSAAVKLADLSDSGDGVIYRYSGQDVTAHIQAYQAGLDAFRGGSSTREDMDVFFGNMESMIRSLFEIAEEDIMDILGELNDGLEMYEARSLEIDPMTIEFFSVVFEDLKAKLSTESAAFSVTTDEDDVVDTPVSTQADTLPKASAAKTIRVDERKIDHFLDSVGKLITQSEILNHLQVAFKGAGVNPALIREFSTVNRSISSDIVSLQRSIMEVRQVEINNALKKFPRLVRDISHTMGKEVELSIHGERTPIDKSLLDDVEAALIHIVRNAIDHGLETPEERQAAGKHRRGTIRIMVSQEETFIRIDISDNGRGLDIDSVRQVAIQRGIVSQDESDQLTREGIEALVFRSGLTTKSAATDISGRGVGMDVVRSNIRKWNGEVSLESRPQQGLTVHLKIPVTHTLLTREAIMLRLEDSTFCLPLEQIEEIVIIPEERIHTHKGQAVFQHRDRIIAITDIKQLLNMKVSQGNHEKEVTPVIIIRGNNGMLRSICADEVLGQQKIVIKDFEIQDFRRLPYFSGLTLLGDGRVVLVLDAEKIMESQ